MLARLERHRADAYQSKIREFQSNRIASIKNGDTPMETKNGPKFVLHIFPLSATDDSASVDIQRVARGDVSIRPMNASGWNTRMNLDGCLVHDSDGEKPCRTYAQLYRSGIIEFVESRLFCSRSGKVDGLIPPDVLERAAVTAVRDGFKVLASLEIEAPILVLAAMTGVKGFAMAGNHGSFRDECRYVDRDDLVFPEVLSESMNPNVPVLLRPIFDAIWQSAGFPGSLNYTTDGTWNLRML